MQGASNSGLRRFGARAVTGLLVLGSAICAGPASAHLDPSPATVKPGAKAAIRFTVAHGCSGSPTTKVTMKLPAGLRDPVPTAPTGWTATVAGGVATFSGPPIAATRKTTVSLAFTAPAAEATLRFPAVQYCVKGENDWIEPTPAKGPEPKYPAPIVIVSAKPTSPKATHKAH